LFIYLHTGGHDPNETHDGVIRFPDKPFGPIFTDTQFHPIDNDTLVSTNT